MNDEEIEDLTEFSIDLTDIDELALGLEICSKKSNMVIQEFIDTIVQLQQENKKYKEVIDKAIDYVENGDLLYLASKCSIIYRNNVEVVAICDRLNELLDILKEVE